MCVVNYLLMFVRHCGFFHSLDICKRPQRRKYQYQPPSTKSSIKCACSLHLAWCYFFALFLFPVRRYFATIHRICRYVGHEISDHVFLRPDVRGLWCRGWKWHALRISVNFIESLVYTLIGIMCAVCHRLGDYYFRLVHGKKNLLLFIFCVVIG